MTFLKFLTPQERASKFPGVQRLFFRSEVVQQGDPYAAPGGVDAPMISDEEDANLVGSMTNVAGIHMPVLDIDFPARLEPSTTPGHFHLYLDIPMTWDEYDRLLAALQGAGILEPGFVGASRAKGGTFVRKPGVAKPLEQRFRVGDRVQVVDGPLAVKYRGATFTVAERGPNQYEGEITVRDWTGVTYYFKPEDLSVVRTAAAGAYV